MNQYISKKIAIILKEKGFNQKQCDNYYYILLDDKIRKSENINYTYKICAAPLYQDLIEWIFSWENSSLDFTESKKYIIEWLEFWYQTLIPELTTFEKDIIVPEVKDNDGNILFEEESTLVLKVTNEFVLEGFIGMLLNWFNKNTNYHLYIDCGDRNKNYWTINRYKERNWIGGTDNKAFSTSQQARNEGIKQIFKLLKDEK